MLQLFGSFATGLYLPTSDMDLVVTDSDCSDVRSGLRALAAALSRKSMAKNIQVGVVWTACTCCHLWFSGAGVDFIAALMSWP